jgi:hypothetical protein
MLKQMTFAAPRGNLPLPFILLLRFAVLNYVIAITIIVQCYFLAFHLYTGQHIDFYQIILWSPTLCH